MIYGELENFVGALLAEAREAKLLTPADEREMRRRILDE